MSSAGNPIQIGQENVKTGTLQFPGTLSGYRPGLRNDSGKNYPREGGKKGGKKFTYPSGSITQPP